MAAQWRTFWSISTITSDFRLDEADVIKSRYKGRDPSRVAALSHVQKPNVGASERWMRQIWLSPV